MLTQDVTPSQEELVRVFFESVEPSTKKYAVVQYITASKSFQNLYRHSTKCFRHPKTDHPKKNKRTLFIKLIVLTAHGNTLEKRADH